jgi:hypothetical protein
MPSLPPHARVDRIALLIDEAHIGLAQGVAVYQQCLAAHLQRVAGHTNDPFDVAALRVMRRRKDHDVAALRLGKGRKPHSGARDLCAIDKLVDKEKIPDEQGALHRTGRDLEGFDADSTNQVQENERD